MKVKKTTLILILAAFISSTVYAQDIVTLKNADEIQAKVIEINQTEILYKKWDNQDGPTYRINKDDVLFIKYVNGNKEVFGTAEKQKKVYQTNSTGKVSFNAYVEIGCPFTAEEAGPSVNASLGANLFNYGFVGLTFGMDALFTTNGLFDAANFPILLNLRGCYPVRNNLCPFLELSLGPNILTNFGKTGYYYYNSYSGASYFQTQNITLTTFRFRLIGGIEYKRFFVGIGYDLISVSGENFHMGYAKIGYRLGK